MIQEFVSSCYHITKIIKDLSILKIAVKVIPKASRNEVVGWEGEVLKVRLTAAPEKGKANESLITILSKHFKIPKSAITILKGETSRHKVVQLDF